MGNRGVLLYVDLGKLEDEPYRLSKIYDTLGQYIDDIRRQRDIIYIMGKLSMKGTMALPHLMRPRPKSTLVM